jgi:hypothetical protein
MLTSWALELVSSRRNTSKEASTTTALIRSLVNVEVTETEKSKKTPRKKNPNQLPLNLKVVPLQKARLLEEKDKLLEEKDRDRAKDKDRTRAREDMVTRTEEEVEEEDKEEVIGNKAETDLKVREGNMETSRQSRLRLILVTQPSQN